LSSSLVTDDCGFIDLLVYRCKALDSVFPCLPEPTNILDPTDALIYLLQGFIANFKYRKAP
jgi:hypothetical protein